MEALREMRRVRRRRFVERLDLMEVLYRVYVAAIFGAIGIGVLAGAIDEAPATPAAVDWVRAHGPALLGACAAVLGLAGLRAGAHGGPLAIEAAEVQYAMLAPVDRGAALRPAAIKQLRTGVLGGAVVGGVLGIFVSRRLPGSPVEWVGSLALFGGLLSALALGCAMLASGRRLSGAAATASGALLVAWSAADLLAGWTTSPGTLLGELATVPLQDGVRVVLAALGLALTAALVGLGLAGIGGIALEAARRRAQLAAELRFSASVRDLRTVVLLRRQLASERPRRRPWLALADAPTRFPIWRRGWRSFLRWPAGRVLRAAVLALAAGALAAGAWSGAALALFAPGLVLFVVALDIVEPLAQESDRPTRRRLLPVASGRLVPGHLAAPTVAIAAMVLVAALGALAVGRSAGTALGVGAVLCLPLGLALACCAAFSATADPYAYVLAPEVGYAVTAAPVAASSLIVGVPLLVAREAERQGAAAVGAAAGISLVVGLIALVLVFVLAQRFAKRDSAAVV
jgi:hypothetical protein